MMIIITLAKSRPDTVIRKRAKPLQAKTLYDASGCFATHHNKLVYAKFGNGCSQFRYQPLAFFTGAANTKLGLNFLHARIVYCSGYKIRLISMVSFRPLH